MQKRLTKILSVLLLALTFVFSSNVFVLAEEKTTYVSTETMEIRTGEKPGLRIISTIDKAYFEEQTSNGKQIKYGTVVVPASALEADGGELVLNGKYKLKDKNYNALNIPAENNWKVTDKYIYFTAVLTGITGSGFNTRYAVRPYVEVDGVVTYGNTEKQSSYTAAQNMISSKTVSTDSKSWITSNVIDVCDDARKVTKDTLTITSDDLKDGIYTLETTDTNKFRNYKKVIIDSSVQGGEIIFNNIRIRNLEIEEGVIATITANNISFDNIAKSSIGKSRSTGNLVLDLGEKSNVAQLSALSNMTVNGGLKIAKITVDEKVENFVIGAPAGELTVDKEAEGSNITLNSAVESAEIKGKGSVIAGSGTIENVDGEDEKNNNIGVKILGNKIKSVEVRGMNRMIVTLDRPTKNTLTVDDMTIICHGGKDMTILKVETTDNQVYTVTTSIFAKDDTYTFSIKTETGKIIQKEFSYKVNCPTFSDATVLRSEETKAELDLFDVDEAGYVYVYIPGHTQVSRASESEPSVETVKKGYKKDMKTGFNKVVINGLNEGISYQLYYVLEAVDGRTSEVLGPIEINGNVQEDPNASKEYQIVSVVESPKNTITVELNKAPKEELSLKNFSFICPTDSNITIDKAKLTVSEDRRTYTIVIPENYGHKDNQYIAVVTFADGTLAKKNFVVEFNPPRITEQKVERVSETKAIYSFVSDKNGVVYYGTYNFNGSYNGENNTPTGSQIINGEVKATKTVLHSGYNKIEFEYNGTDKDIFALHVDELGNYAAYTEHHKIPVYTPPVKPEETKLEIESIVYNKEESGVGTCLDITFTTEIDELPSQSLIKFEVISGSSPGKLLLERSFIRGDQKLLRIRSLNAKFKAGTYKISMYVYKDDQLTKVEKEFVID